MEKNEKESIRIRLSAECLKRSKFGSCRMECEIDKSRDGYCREVWKKASE